MQAEAILVAISNMVAEQVTSQEQENAEVRRQQLLLELSIDTDSLHVCAVCRGVASGPASTAMA